MMATKMVIASLRYHAKCAAYKQFKGIFVDSADIIERQHNAIRRLRDALAIATGVLQSEGYETPSQDKALELTKEFLE